MTRRSAVAVLGTAPLAFAGDPWKDKPASAWSEKDANRLRDRSPWSRVTTPEIQGMGGGGMAPGGGRGGRGGRGGGGGAVGGAMDASGGSMGGGGGAAGGAGGMSEGIPSRPQVTVRWESAKPMQEASALLESPFSKQIAKLSEQFYILSAEGFPIMGGRGNSNVPAEDRAKMMQQRLKQGTTLKRKGKPDIAAEQVGMAKGKKGPILIFLFPRTDAISPADRDVVFEASAGPAKVKSKFSLKEMVYHGEPAL